MSTLKYYIPTLEEFHYGFEYEEGDGYDPPKEWSKETIGKTISGDLEDLDDQIREGQIRVKHLDQSDIESFGFEHIGDDTFINGKFEIELSPEYKTSILEDNAGIIRILFLGQIKNKSELKKILQMVGVI